MQDENVYQPPQSTTDTGRQPGGFGHYNLDRSFALGWDAFKEDLGFGVGFTIVFFLITTIAALTCIGIPAALPQLMASIPIVGLMMIRRRSSMNNLFAGFNAYGAVFIAMLLLGLIHLVFYFIFAAPSFFMMVKDLDFASMKDLSFEEIATLLTEHMTKLNSDFSGARLLTTLFSYLYYPVSFYFGGRFILAYPLIIDRKYEALAAIKTSWLITAPYQWHMMLMIFLIGLVSVSGLLACCVGILFSFPLSVAIQGAVIYQFFGEDAAVPSSAPATQL